MGSLHYRVVTAELCGPHLIIVARRSRSQADPPGWESHLLGELAGAPADVRPVLTRQLAQLPLVDVGVVLRGDGASLQVPLETDRAAALALDAQLSPVVAARLVGPGLRAGTLRRLAVALGGHRAVGLHLADLVGVGWDEAAGVAAAAGPLAGAALGAAAPLTPFGRGVVLPVLVAQQPRVAALVLALVVVVAAVALLPGFHDLVAAERPRRRREAVALLVVLDGVQDVRNIADAAARELAVVGAVAARRRREHDEVAVEATRAALRRVVVRRSEVVADLVGQRQLGHLGGHPAVVIDERDDSGVERALRRLVHPPDGLSVSLVSLADASRRSRRAGHPSQTQRAAGEVPVGEDVRQAEVLVVAQRVDVEEVADVDVFQTKLIHLAATMMGTLAGGIVVDLDPLYFEFNIAMFASTVELGIAINVINGSDVMCDQRQDFFSGLLVDVVLLPGVGVLRKTFSYVPPDKRIRLDVQRTSVLVFVSSSRPLASGVFVVRLPRIFTEVVLLILDGLELNFRVIIEFLVLSVFVFGWRRRRRRKRFVVDAGVLDAVHPLDDIVVDAATCGVT
jgi:hypothetical protein